MDYNSSSTDIYTKRSGVMKEHKEYEVKKKILRIFRENGEKFISGEEISSEMGFTRAGVWKYITKLREEGFEIEAVPHLGYRLHGVPDALRGYDISGSVDTKTIGCKAIYDFESTSSTNEVAYGLAEKGEPEGTVVLSERQTKGRGRMGRKWISPKGGIYMSLVLRPDVGADEIPALTIIAAIAVARAVRVMSGIEPGVKWPNDLYVKGKKLCGILTEIKAQPDMVDFLILGIGINVNTSENDLPDGATSLKVEYGKHINRAEFVKIILEEFERDYCTFREKGFMALRDECRQKSLILGSNVKIDVHNGVIEGLAFDLDEKGALLVRNSNGIVKRVFSGDVILCR